MLVFKVRGVVEASESRLDCFWPMVLSWCYVVIWYL
jgi:hypothetical protein